MGSGPRVGCQYALALRIGIARRNDGCSREDAVRTTRINAVASWP